MTDEESSNALFKNKKLWLVIIVAAGALLFYAVGIVTNLFASPVFSAFWVISSKTAYDIVAYAAAVAAVVIILLGFALNFMKRGAEKSQPQEEIAPAPIAVREPVRELVEPESPAESPPLVASPLEQDELPREEPVASVEEVSSVETSKTAATLKMSSVQETPETVDDLIASTQQTQRKRAQPKRPVAGTKKTTSPKPKSQVKPESPKKEFKITCPNCHKGFTKPIYSIDYNSPEPKIVGHCPYCDTALQLAQTKADEEDLWKKYFKANT